MQNSSTPRSQQNSIGLGSPGGSQNMLDLNGLLGISNLAYFAPTMPNQSKYFSDVTVSYKLEAKVNQFRYKTSSIA